MPDTSDKSATRTTRVWHEQHKCKTSQTQTTRAQHEHNTGTTRVLHKWHECDTSATRKTQVWHEWKIFDFDNDTSENIFSHSYISCMANERLQEEEQFHFKKQLLEIPRSHAKMHLKSASHKLNFVITKAISKSYTLDCSWKCPCTFPPSYA